MDAQEPQLTPWTWAWRQVIANDGTPMLVVDLHHYTGVTVLGMSADEGAEFAGQLADQLAQLGAATRDRGATP